jgi:hypothetical protein
MTKAEYDYWTAAIASQESTFRLLLFICRAEFTGLTTNDLVCIAELIESRIIEINQNQD